MLHTLSINTLLKQMSKGWNLHTKPLKIADTAVSHFFILFFNLIV